MPPAPLQAGDDNGSGEGRQFLKRKDSSASPRSPSVERGPQRKRKAGGGRGVATLSQEQLAKKRANDREAQRNIRERTKAMIEGLERTIEQLRSQQPYQELQRVIREREALEAENAELKRRMGAIMTLIQPFSGTGPEQVQGAPRHGGNASTMQETAARGPAASPVVVLRTEYHQDHFMRHEGTPASTTSTTYSMPWQATGSRTPESQAGPVFAPRPRSPTGQSTLLGMASSIYRVTDNEQEALNLLRLGNPQGASDTARRSNTTRNSAVVPIRAVFSPGLSNLGPAQAHVVDESTPHHLRVPLIGRPTCTLDNIVLTFNADIEKRLSQGLPIPQAVGPEEPDWRYIQEPECISPAEESYNSPLSHFFGQVLSNRMFPDLQKPPEKFGSAYLLYKSNYWLLTKSQSAFDKVPSWLRPTHKQQTIPHGSWVDAMFWPKMRDAVLAAPQEYVFDDLFVPLTRSVSCNWPYGNDAIFEVMPAGRLQLSRRFLEHITKLDNWTMGPEFAQAYPKLVGTYHSRAGDGPTLDGGSKVVV